MAKEETKKGPQDAKPAETIANRKKKKLAKK